MKIKISKQFTFSGSPHKFWVLTFSAIIAGQIEWTLTIESARQIDTCCSWRTRCFLTVDNIRFTIFTRKSDGKWSCCTLNCSKAKRWKAKMWTKRTLVDRYTCILDLCQCTMLHSCIVRPRMRRIRTDIQHRYSRLDMYNLSQSQSLCNCHHACLSIQSEIKSIKC